MWLGLATFSEGLEHECMSNTHSLVCCPSASRTKSFFFIKEQPNSPSRLYVSMGQGTGCRWEGLALDCHCGGKAVQNLHKLER